jgi:alpha-mannosidase
MAKHETVAHRWVHVGEPGFGVAVANDSTYGHDIVREQYGEDGPVGTTVRLSLVRGPKFPDPDTDQGRHRLQVSLVVGADIVDAVLEGQRLNQPLRRISGADAVEPLVSARPEGVIVESVKMAEDGSGDVVVRLYESLGRRTPATVQAAFGSARVQRTDLLERPTGADALDADGGRIRMDLRPFEILTLRFSGVGAR